MTLLPVSCVRAWPHSMGGIQMGLAPGVFAGSPEHEVYYGLVEAAAWGGQVPEALTVSLVQSSL